MKVFQLKCINILPLFSFASGPTFVSGTTGFLGTKAFTGPGAVAMGLLRGKTSLFFCSCPGRTKPIGGFAKGILLLGGCNLLLTGGILLWPAVIGFFIPTPGISDFLRRSDDFTGLKYK